jgi:phosphatidylserine decarboxylase
MSLRDKYLFLQQLGNGFSDIGAIFPTGSPAARSLCSEIRRTRGPKRILEVGCGTGPVTEAVIDAMSDEDTLTVCDLNESFMNYVKKRFEEEPKFAARADQVSFYIGDVTELGTENAFDIIISSIPFTTLESDMLKKVIAHYKFLLTPGGSLTYIEYAYFRDIRDALQPVHKDARYEQVSDQIREMLESYEFRSEVIRSNFPPAVVRSLRFEQPKPEAATGMKPDPERRRVSIGPFSFCTDGMPVVGAFLGAGLAWKASGRRGWQLPMAMAGFAAWFHRDPKRLIVANKDLCLSAADGHIIGVRDSRHPRLGDENWTRIEIFLSVADVHINRAPVAGRVVDRWDEPGGFSPAFLGSAEDNDSSYIVLENEVGRCAIAQRSGVVARKIFTWCQRGEILTQGERFGMIRFGSRTDIYLPKDQVEVLVSQGDKVLAGRTPIARFIDQ